MQLASSNYAKALTELSLGNKALAMLRAHFLAPERTIGYRELAIAAGYPDAPSDAYRWYCTLGLRLGEQLGMTFDRLAEDEHRYSAVIATGDPNTVDLMEHKFIMRPELVEALVQLGWFR